MKLSNTEITSFTNVEGVDVTKQLQQGDTISFTDRFEAIEYANKINSYVYDLICIVSKKGSKKIKKPYGYAVPN